MTQREFEGRNMRYRQFFFVAGFTTIALLTIIGFALVPSAWFLVAFLALLVIGMYIDNRVVTRLGLRCPACKRHLNSCSRFVLATSKCRCGKQILEGTGDSV